MTLAHRPNVRLNRIRGCALVFAILAATTAPMSVYARADDPKNAATWYARAIASWQQFKQSSPAQYELITNYHCDPAQPITPEVRAALTGVQGVMSDMRKGSQQEHCDFALDYGQGFELMLPHLNEMRGIARAMKADATVRLADGDTSGAATSLSSMYRTSGHCGDDRVLISSLVGQAIFATADGSVQAGLDTAAFNAADAAALLGGAKELGAIDPFAYVEAVSMEQEIAIVSLEKFRGPEGMKALNELLGGGEGGAEFAEKIGALDDAGFDEALSQYDSVMTKMSAIFMLTDKDAAVAEALKMRESIAAGEYGPLAQALAPAHSKLLERKFQGEQMVADRIATLAALASGAQKPEEAANAAVWYLRAIEMLDLLPPEQLQPVRTAPTSLDHDLPVTLAKSLEQWQAIIDVVREGSIKRRCDFTAVTPHRGPPPIAPHYTPGMHDLFRLLLADAVRLLRADDAASATDRLAIALRMAAHLGLDPNLASNRIAHVQFNRTIDLIEAALAGARLPSPPPAALADAAARVSRKDPFGYLETMSRTRDAIISRFNNNSNRSGEEALKNWATQQKTIRQFTGDQLMYVLVMLDTRSKRMAEAGPSDPLQRDPTWQTDDITTNSMLERLTDVLAYEGIDAARAEYADVGPRIAAEDWDIFVGREIQPIAQIGMTLGRARGDLRRATQLLMLNVHAEAANAGAAAAESKP